MPNKSMETSRRQWHPFDTRRELGRAIRAPRFLAAAVVHLFRSPACA